MDIWLHERPAYLDVHGKAMIVACVRVMADGKALIRARRDEHTTLTTDNLRSLLHLADGTKRCLHVATEATWSATSR